MISARPDRGQLLGSALFAAVQESEMGGKLALAEVAALHFARTSPGAVPPPAESQLRRLSLPRLIVAAAIDHHIRPMTLRTAFPTTSAAYPDLLDWDVEFDWTLPAGRVASLQLVVAQRQVPDETLDTLFHYCDAVAADLDGMAPTGEVSPSADIVDAFRFMFAVLPMEVTLAAGLNGDCYGWANWSLVRNFDRRARVLDVLWSFFPPDSQAPVEFQNLALSHLPRWSAAFFMLARKFGGLDVIADAIGPHCWDICAQALRMGADQDQCMDALLSLTNWAVNIDRPEAAGWVQALLPLWHGELSNRSRAHLGVLMMTKAHRFTGRDAQVWAKEMLDHWRPILTEHLLLQTLAASLRTYDDWIARRDEILTAASELAQFYSEGSPDRKTAIQALESRVSIIHPLVYLLTEQGTVDDLLDLLGAWYSAPPGRNCDGSVLIVASAHRHGVGYLWPNGGRLIVDRNDAAGTFEQLMEAASVAQRDFHRVNGVGDQLLPIDVRRIGQPDEAAGPAFEEATRAHFAPDRLAAALPAAHGLRSMLTVPALPVPVGAILATEAGTPAAQEVSLRQGLPDRRIRRIAVWPGSTMHAAFEVEALQCVADRAGWELDLSDVGDDPEQFISFYERDDADLLWVIGHGEHSPYRLEESGLAFGNHLISAERLLNVPTGSGERRLLVLNVCSGAATQVRGGLARVGLSHEIVGPAQHVIAHLWPIGMYTGLAFGAKLALELASSPTAEAYSATIRGLRSPNQLLPELVDRLGPDLGIHERLANQSAQIGNVMSWGAPVLLT